MSRLHEIQSRITSVKDTRKITRAMYLISASKAQRAKGQLEKTLPYFEMITTTLFEILASEVPAHTYFIGHKRATEGKGNLYIVLGSDKGMAGGYNRNILSRLEAEVDKETATLLVAGQLGRSQIAREGYRVDHSFDYPVMNPSIHGARTIAEVIAEKYLTHEYREIHIIYTAMVTPLRMEPVVARLLPLHPEDFLEVGGIKKQKPERDVILYDPDPREVFDHLVPHYLMGIIFGAFVEAFTCEQTARRFAMDNATKSADEMIEHLTLRYNRARQAQITQEISEIVSGIPNG